MAITAIAESRSIEEIGVRRNLLEDLALKILYQVGEMTLHELACHMGFSLGVMETVFERLARNSSSMSTAWPEESIASPPRRRESHGPLNCWLRISTLGPRPCPSTTTSARSVLRPFTG